MSLNLRLRKIAISGFALFTGVLLSGCACAELYEQSIKEPPGTRAKPMKVHYREIERGIGFSITEYKIVSGPSVAVIMFGVRGDCAIARREGWSHYASETIDGATPGWTRYRLSRADAPPHAASDDSAARPKKIWALEDCKLLGF
jgi:hypothetical protein